LEYPGIPAFSRLVDRITQRPELRILCEPLASGQAQPGCCRCKSASLEKIYSACNPVLVIRIEKRFDGADRKCFGRSTDECRRTENDIVINRLTVVLKKA
jgi:hypothetical protein